MNGLDLSDENKRYIVKEFLKNLEHISDKEYQMRVWIRAEGPECDDFDETVNHFFPDCESLIENNKDFWITDIQKAILFDFYNQFETFKDGRRPYLPEEFIDTPEWTNITEMAKEVLKAFNYQKK